MKTEIDFPSADETHVRATAWALGQLTPEEATAFEAEMATNPGLAAYAEEMRQFSHLLASEFPTDDSGQLPEASRSHLVSVLSQSVPTPQSFVKRHWKILSLTTAAAAGIMLTLRPDWLHGPEVSGLAAGRMIDGSAPSPPPLFTGIDESIFKSKEGANPSDQAAARGFGNWQTQPGAIRPLAGEDRSKNNFYQLYSRRPNDPASPSLAPLSELTAAPAPDPAKRLPVALTHSDGKDIPSQGVGG